MMTRDTVLEAIEEARRFIVRAEALLNSEVKLDWVPADPKKGTKGHYNVRRWADTMDNGKLQGAVRRASMDLTRALAAMRKHTS